ncbi:TIGR00296 family protein [Candidatus Woesearchaeota archaeon]|jgi:uncharacterized protein|nr:TIGR00296 family protein [Candidatus Woesearchaeota archaeon]
MLSKAEGQELIKSARSAIFFELNSTDPYLKVYETKFEEKQGLFVTLNKNNELRGCIGFPQPILPLNQAIIEAATAAAFEDPRFPPVTKEELDKIQIELSVLSVPELIKVNSPEEYLDKINIGIDGLIIHAQFTSGLLLPQVFTEHNCSPLQALQMLCQKAGLGINSWKDQWNKEEESIQIFKFQAQIFEEIQNES